MIGVPTSSNFDEGYVLAENGILVLYLSVNMAYFDRIKKVVPSRTWNYLEPP